MIAVGGDIAFEVAEDGVVLEEVGQGLGIRDVVDRDDLEIGSTTRGTVDIAPHAAKPLNANLYRHEVLLPCQAIRPFRFAWTTSRRRRFAPAHLPTCASSARPFSPA